MDIECESCKADLEIKENILFISGEKKLEKANCPNCETEVYQATTDGWFYVEVKGEIIHESSEVVFPMP